MTAQRFLTAAWRDLVMINYEIDPAVLAPLVPTGTELDAWSGRTLVSLVGFRFLDTRLLGIPIPFHRDFDEVNLRFYVRRHAPDGMRRGVVFVREIVPRAAVAWVARTVYNENYVAWPMRHDTRLPGPPGSPRDETASSRGFAVYGWRTGGRWHELGASVEGPPALPSLGSEEEFITEHYWGYARQRDGSTVEYQVEHPQWRVWRATETRLDCDVPAVYGAQYQSYLSGTPSSAFVADGSAVTVRRASPLTSPALPGESRRGSAGSAPGGQADPRSPAPHRPG
jgi:uncharacterized protein YqjF (DUF2071 family)